MKFNFSVGFPLPASAWIQLSTHKKNPLQLRSFYNCTKISKTVSPKICRLSHQCEGAANVADLGAECRHKCAKRLRHCTWDPEPRQRRAADENKIRCGEAPPSSGARRAACPESCRVPT